ncbi:MAG: tetratricopeptide repeat protein [Phycisphaerales bacterium]|nr:tetratricopeptide repeat protein [Phycisphaerales bacterium]MCB9863830.1 tetratricopeptide repeat protein [Phycisphaerales bacterium]
MKHETRPSTLRRSAFACFVAISMAATAVAQPSGQAPPRTPEAKAADEAFRKQDWAAAASAYEAITKANPDDGIAWYRLGFARHALGEYDKAIPAHKKAAEFPQVRPTALYNLACALSLTGDKNAAFASLDDSIDAGFGDLKQFESDSDLKSLHDDARFAVARRRLTPIADLVREFDFWVGTWDVFDGNGNQVGTNRIEKVENGCLIIEHWSNMRGNTGQSYNFIDPTDRKWRQVWVDGAGNVVRYEGVVKDGAMHFTGNYTPQRGRPAIARGSLTPDADGKVRHVIEHSDDNGKTWKPYFNGIYIRQDKTAKPETANTESSN